MVLRIQSTSDTSGSKEKPRNGHTRPMALTFTDLSKPGRLRTGHMMTLFSVSHSTLYKQIKSNVIPKPDGKDGKRPYWLHESVRPFLQKK